MVGLVMKGKDWFSNEGKRFGLVMEGKVLV